MLIYASGTTVIFTETLDFAQIDIINIDIQIPIIS